MLWVDKHAHRRNVVPEFVHQVHYGRLLQIFVLTLPASPVLHLEAPLQVVLARIRPCQASPSHIPHQISFQERVHNATAPEVVDISTLSSLVGRLIVDGIAYIIDRTEGEGDPQYQVIED